jgi:chromatin assembly factor 1 subunit A
LDSLEDRTTIPAKIFIFHEDTRPGYFGTWTRISSTIRPRRPFARDVVAIDYSYDSSEEWEEENPGDADDVVDDNDDDDEGDAGEDSDADSWLVDDDVEVIAPMDEVDTPPPPKRNLEGASGAGGSYKKRRVVPLVPFVKGPVWDPAITRTVEEVLTPFRVRFFNGWCWCPFFGVGSHKVFPRQLLSNGSIHIRLASGNNAPGNYESTVPRAYCS